MEKAGQQNVEGTWTWTRTQGGVGNHILQTPASEGKTVEIQFTAANTYVIKTNGVVSSQGSYELKTRNCIHTGGTKTLVDLSANEDIVIENFDASSLQFSDELHDGLQSFYQRKP